MTDTPQGHPTEVVETSVAPQGTETTQVEAKWYESLPESLRGDKIIQKYDSPEKAFEALVHSNKLLGKRINEASPEDLKRIITPEEVYEVERSRGLPKSLEDYKLDDSIESRLPSDVAKVLKTKALEYKLNPEQMNDLIATEQKLQGDLLAEQRSQWMAATQNMFGQNLDAELTSAVRVIDQYGQEDVPAIKDFLNQTGFGNHPLVIKFLSNIGKAMAEDKVPTEVSTARSNEIADVTTQINTLLNNKKFRSDLSHNKVAQDQLDALYRKQMELQGS